MFSKINTGEKKYFLENKTNMADTEIVKIINIKTDQAITTVKELKNYINDLRDDLVKVDKGSKEYEKTLEEIANAQTKLTEVTKDAKNAINYQEGSYRALNQELVNLRNEYKNLSEAERNNAEVGGAMLSRIQELDTELKSIDATLGNHQRNVGNYKSAIEDVTVSYQTQRQELKALRVALEQLDPSSQEYIKAFNRAAEITHNLTEQQEMLKYSSKDLGDQISNIRGIASNMAAGFSAVNAAMGLFGEKNEDVAKALLKVQQCMAIVQGLQGMDGLLKRTQGLSNAMKAWFTSTTQVTTALNAEAVATNTATVAQRGLNAAMKANPVGLVITAVMGLVTVLSLFSGKIKEAVKNNEKWNKVLGVLKGIAATVGAVLKAHFLVPLKEIVNYFGTLAKVMRDVFTGQWGKIEEDLKQGIKNARDIVVDSIEDIEGAYDGAVQKHLTERERMRAADRTKELEELMELNEAKYGSDWKYTEDGKALYDEYFSNLAYQYDENSDDYKKAVLAKLRYDREYNEKKKKAEEDAAKEEEERRKAAAKAAEDAKKKREQLEQKYQSTIAKSYSVTIRETVNAYKDQLSTLEEFYQLQIKSSDNADVKKVIQEQINKIREEYKKYSNDKIWTMENEAMGFGALTEPEQTKARLKKETENLFKAYNALIKDSLTNSNDEIQRKLNNDITKLFEKTIKPDLTQENAKLQAELNKQLLKLDYEIDINGGKENKENRANLVYQATVQELENIKSHYEQVVEFVRKNNLIPSEEYEQALAILEDVDVKIEQAGIDLTNNLRAINNEYFQKDLADTEAYTANKIRAIKNQYEQETQTGNWWQMLTPVTPEEERAYMDEVYNAQLEGLERVKSLWEQRKNEEGLSYEERLEAEKNFNLAVMDIEDAQLEYEKNISEQRKELVQQYIDMTKEAVGQIANLFGSLADIYEEDIKAKVKAGKMSDKEADRAFESVKAMRIAEAVINTIAGSVGAFLQASATYPPPYGQIIGGITAAAVTASGIAQIAKIKSTSRNGGDSSAASSASVPAPDTSYNYQPMYVANTTGQQDTEYLRNSLTEQPIRAYVVESDISQSQELSRKRNSEGSF